MSRKKSSCQNTGLVRKGAWSPAAGGLLCRPVWPSRCRDRGRPSRARCFPGRRPRLSLAHVRAAAVCTHSPCGFGLAVTSQADVTRPNPLARSRAAPVPRLCGCWGRGLGGRERSGVVVSAPLAERAWTRPWMPSCSVLANLTTAAPRTRALWRGAGRPRRWEVNSVSPGG